MVGPSPRALTLISRANFLGEFLSDVQAAAAHIEGILGAVPHPTFGSICLMPFAVDTDETNQLKKDVASGIATSLDSAGLLSSGEAPTPTRSVRVLCRSCGTMLFSATTDHDGGIGVAAPALLTALAGRRAECPHDAFTPHDLRRHVEEMNQ